MTNQDDSLNLLETLADPTTWGEETSFNYKSERYPMKIFRPMKTVYRHSFVEMNFHPNMNFPPQTNSSGHTEKGRDNDPLCCIQNGKSWFLQNTGNLHGGRDSVPWF